MMHPNQAIPTMNQIAGGGMMSGFPTPNGPMPSTPMQGSPAQQYATMMVRAPMVSPSVPPYQRDLYAYLQAQQSAQNQQNAARRAMMPPQPR